MNPRQKAACQESMCTYIQSLNIYCKKSLLCVKYSITVHMLLYINKNYYIHDNHIKSLCPHGTFAEIYIACFYDAFYNLYFDD